MKIDNIVISKQHHLAYILPSMAFSDRMTVFDHDYPTWIADNRSIRSWLPAQWKNANRSGLPVHNNKVSLFGPLGPVSISDNTSYRKSRNRNIGSLSDRIALKYDGSTPAEVPVKFPSDRTILNTNLAASRLRDILR